MRIKAPINVQKVILTQMDWRCIFLSWEAISALPWSLAAGLKVNFSFKGTGHGLQTHSDNVISEWCSNTFAQSICTHYFSFEKLGRFTDLKKTGLVCGPKKNRVQKNRVWIFFLLFKKRRGSLASPLLDCKLQAEKIWSRPWKKIGLMQPYIF